MTRLHRAIGLYDMGRIMTDWRHQVCRTHHTVRVLQVHSVTAVTGLANLRPD